ncbi:organic solute transport protein 1-domain-containing protein [Chytridium lagenaria]|nr:organic solute transport protein 1-domain-containing protein [Chytridium lagenaria]
MSLLSSNINLQNVVVLVNLGGEMLYILEHRLHSYSDVVRTMLGEAEAAGKQAENMTSSQIEESFYRIAHSSSMRLTDSGLQKLVQLMVMTFKYQLFACSYPLELLFISINHFEVWKKHSLKAGVDDRLSKLRLILEELGTIGGKALCVIRQNINEIFEQNSAKVSQFIGWKIQSPDDGAFIHRPDYKGFTPVPGDYREYEKSEVLQKENLELGRSTILGTNMFCEEAGKIFDASKISVLSSNQYASAATSTASMDHIFDLDQLKHLITFKDSSELSSEEATSSPPQISQKGIPVVHNREAKQLRKDMTMFDSVLTVSAADTNGDLSLLELMDQASLD